MGGRGLCQIDCVTAQIYEQTLRVRVSSPAMSFATADSGRHLTGQPRTLQRAQELNVAADTAN